MTQRKTQTQRFLSAVATLAFTSTFAAFAQAGVIWDAGGANTNINTAQNWDGDALPDLVSGTSNLEFGTNGSSATINTAVSVNSITINRAAAFTLTNGTGTLTIGAGGITTSQNQGRTISESITLGASQTWDVGANTLNVTGAVTDGANSFKLTKAGAGTLTLGTANSFDGGIDSTGSGNLQLNNASAAGTGTITLKGTQGGTSATLTLNGGLTFNNDIIVDNTSGRNNIQTQGGTSVVNSDIHIQGTASRIVIINANSATTYNGDFTSANNTAGNLSFRGNSAAIINGNININHTVDFNPANGSNSYTINSTGNTWGAVGLIGTGASTTTAYVILGVDDALATAARLEFAYNGRMGGLDLNGFDQTLAGIRHNTVPVNGTLDVTSVITNRGASDSILTLANLASDYVYGAGITDGTTNKISLVMNSAGRTQALEGTNTYTGSTTVTAGILDVNTSLANNGANKIFIAKDANDDFTGSPELQRAVGALSSLAGIGATEVGGLGTVASLIGGSTNAATSVDMAFRGRNNALVAGETSLLSSDILQLEGLDGVVFVLQMSYSEAAALANGQTETTLKLGYLNTDTNQWMNAIDGNHGTNIGSFFLSSYTDAGSPIALGSYGVDIVNNVVWAVLDHNSFFAVIPTPGALPAGALLMGLVVAAKRRRQA